MASNAAVPQIRDNCLQPRRNAAIDLQIPGRFFTRIQTDGATVAVCGRIDSLAFLSAWCGQLPRELVSCSGTDGRLLFPDPPIVEE